VSRKTSDEGSLQLLCEPLPFGTDLVDQLRIGRELLPQGHGPRPRVRLGIVDRDLDVHVAEVAAVEAFLERRRETIATLKAMGAEGGQIFLIYLTQIMAVACVGLVLGLAIGAALPFAVEYFFGASIPAPAPPPPPPRHTAEPADAPAPSPTPSAEVETPQAISDASTDSTR